VRWAFLLVFGGLLFSPLLAEDVWTLRTGPLAVTSVPLDPVQLVSAWQAQYSDGHDVVWLYATQSPHFFPPKVPEVVVVSGTPWTVTVFFPSTWKPANRTLWLDRWLVEFRVLATLPHPGFPIVLPSVLRKGQ